MTEIDIHQINQCWFESKHSKTNPKGFNVSDDESEENALQRKKDLVQLLTIIYNYIHEPDNIEYFKNLKDDSLDAFNKYVKTRVIDYYPYEKEVLSLDYIIDNVKKSEFKIWLLNLFTISSKQVSWQPKYDMNGLNVKSDQILKFRFKRFQLLSKICAFLDELQTNDFLKNKIKIIVVKEKGKVIITGNRNNLVYGHKHILSAYLGQHIVRMFPFKDFNYFKSTALVENPAFESVYEHFTPMSFFRDIIWVKPQSTADILFDNNSKPYNQHQWLSILWYTFRTIHITAEQDKKYLNKGYKSRRLFNCYDTLGIEINNRTLWDDYHSLESLKKQLQ